jgi:hypothetical protein
MADREELMWREALRVDVFSHYWSGKEAIRFDDDRLGLRGVQRQYLVV